MNFLAHAFLSFDDAALLTGNMIGDHVKGTLALGAYPDGIRKGIELHRRIDAKTDGHPATLRARLLFRQHYGLYSGAIVDVLYDHFLANDPKYFANEAALAAFAQTVYARLAEYEAYFPAAFAAYFPHMRQHNWLAAYRQLKGMERALNGLARKAAHMPPVQQAYETFVTQYYTLNQCYYEFIDDMIDFVKIETRK